MFVRVIDKITGHEFDVAEQAFNPEKYRKVPKVPLAKSPRRVTLAEPKKTAKEPSGE